jgi:hypothetical protein
LKAFRNENLQIKLRDTLRSKERALWLYENAWAPKLHIAFLLYGLVFITIWCAIVFDMLGIGLLALATAESGSVFAIIPLLFVAIGVGQFLLTVWALFRIKSFAYAVTDQRVIILNSFPPVFARSFGPEYLLSMSRSGSEAQGTINLRGSGVNVFTHKYFDYFMPPKLVSIPDPKHVENLIYENLVAPFRMQLKEKHPNRKPNLFHGY